MAQYVVTITNGTGSQILPKGKYDVTASVPGYAGTLDPSTFTASELEGNQSFTIAATGTITLHVNDTGASGGTPVTSGSFIRCNSDGTETYGTAKTIDAMGACTFDFVPFGTSEAPIDVYVKQLTSDETHNVHPGVVTVSMSEPNQTQYVQNTPAALQSFTFADANYAGLNLNGTLTFEGPQES